MLNRGNKVVLQAVISSRLPPKFSKHETSQWNHQNVFFFLIIKSRFVAVMRMFAKQIKAEEILKGRTFVSLYNVQLLTYLSSTQVVSARFK